MVNFRGGALESAETSEERIESVDWLTLSMASVCLLSLVMIRSKCCSRDSSAVHGERWCTIIDLGFVGVGMAICRSVATIVY